MWREWISESELRVIREALAGSWNPPVDEAEVRRTLAWFPDERLVRWFLEGDGCERGEVRALRLEDAMAWRRQMLLRDLPSPLSSKDRFLPLVRCEEGFLIYDGAAKGVALRRTSQPERYERALESAMPLSELLEATPPPSPPRARMEEEDDDDEEEPHREEIPLEHHFTRVFGARTGSVALEALTSLCDAPELRAWFTRVGPSTRLLLTDLRAHALADALVVRDQLEGAASAELQAQLHHLSWMPLLELPGRHAVLFWKDRGVRLHVFRDDAWQAASWARTLPLETFAAGLSAWCEPALEQEEDAGLADEFLWVLADAFEDTPDDHDVDSSRLQGFAQPVQEVLEHFFARVSERALADAKQKLVATDQLEPGLSIAPLLEGEDGVQTCAVDGRGVVLRVGEARLPWAASVTSWLEGLQEAASERGTLDVRVTRDFVGNYRVELPLLPYELARKLEKLSEPLVLDPNEFSIARGEEAAVQVIRFKPTLVLDEPARAELVRQLDGLRQPELSCLSVTFVFKPLQG